jgi:hypothetical protein
MVKKEQQLTIKLNKYLKAKTKPSYFFEVKYVRTTNYAFRSDKSFSNELRNLLIGERAGVMYKFSDMAALGTPFDCMFIKAPGYFFIHWESSKKTYMIPVKNMEMIVESGVKSLSENTAHLISVKVIIL